MDGELLEVGDLLAPRDAVDSGPAQVAAAPVVVGEVIGLGRIAPTLPPRLRCGKFRNRSSAGARLFWLLSGPSRKSTREVG